MKKLLVLAVFLVALTVFAKMEIDISGFIQSKISELLGFDAFFEELNRGF